MISVSQVHIYTRYGPSDLDSEAVSITNQGGSTAARMWQFERFWRKVKGFGALIASNWHARLPITRNMQMIRRHGHPLA